MWSTRFPPHSQIGTRAIRLGSTGWPHGDPGIQWNLHWTDHRQPQKSSTTPTECCMWAIYHLFEVHGQSPWLAIRLLQQYTRSRAQNEVNMECVHATSPLTAPCTMQFGRFTHQLWRPHVTILCTIIITQQYSENIPNTYISMSILSLFHHHFFSFFRFVCKKSHVIIPYQHHITSLKIIIKLKASSTILQSRYPSEMGFFVQFCIFWWPDQNPKLKIDPNSPATTPLSGAIYQLVVGISFTLRIKPLSLL